MYGSTMSHATITLRVLLRADRCYRLVECAQEMCSALSFIAGLRNGRMQEHLADARMAAEAHSTVHTRNGRVVFAAAG